MSTRKKESVSNVREIKSSPKPSKPVSTSRSLGSSPSSEKAIPNYLKPTLSSSGDATKIQGRRPVSNTDSGLKSNLVRRRSFDKPPSPTRTTLKTRGVSPTPTFRSSSFSGKTGTGRAVTSPKSERSLKGTTRDVGKQHLYARAVGTLKKSATIASKSKAETAAAAATASSRKKDSSDHQESSSVEEDPVVADQELDNSNEQAQGEIDEDTLEDESHKADDSPTVLEQHVADVDDAAEVESSPTILEQRDASTGEAESPTICEESDDNVAKIESPTLPAGQDDGDADKAESPVNSEQRVESPTVSEKSCIEEISSSQQQEMEEDTNPDQGAAGNPNEDEAEEAKAVDIKVEGEGEAGEVEQGVVEEAPRLSHGKKDVGLSNNVIEEMTREQRRNKVRALAGAFETVISLQDHK